MEKNVVLKVGISVMYGCGCDPDLDLIPQYATLDDVPGRDADKYLNQFMRLMERLNPFIDTGIDEIAGQLDTNSSMEIRCDIGHRVWDVRNAVEY